MLDLKKNESLQLDLTKVERKKINIGLGWDTRADLDVHAVLFDENKNNIGVVYYGKKSYLGVELSGDNLTGAGNGDDEIIYVDLNKVHEAVKNIRIYVNVYTDGMTFGDVKGSYVRLFNPYTGEAYAKSVLDCKDHAKDNTILFADLEIGSSIDFKVVMVGSKKSVSSLVGPIKKIIEPVQEKEKEKPRKKFFGLF